MDNQERKLTVEEANQRVRRSVDELEDIINKFNRTPEKRDVERREDIASLFMSFLAETYGLAAPSESSSVKVLPC